MPFDAQTFQFRSREILIEPEYGFGWLLVGTYLEPVEVNLPEAFTGMIKDILGDSGTGQCLVAQCRVKIADSEFSWIGLIPRTDSLVKLTEPPVFCKLMLSSAPPELAQHDSLRGVKFMRSQAKVFVRGSAKIGLMPQ